VGKPSLNFYLEIFSTTEIQKKLTAGNFFLYRTLEHLMHMDLCQARCCFQRMWQRGPWLTEQARLAQGSGGMPKGRC
jgi:hypothetical protein